MVYAANNKPLTCEDTWFSGGRWALLSRHHTQNGRNHPPLPLWACHPCHPISTDPAEYDVSLSMLLSIYKEMIIPLCETRVHMKQTLKTLVLHPDLNKLYRKPIPKVVAAWVTPEVRFLLERAGCKREHHKLSYNKTSKLTSHHIFLHIDYYCLSISVL
jgi:hypothetical protein